MCVFVVRAVVVGCLCELFGCVSARVCVLLLLFAVCCVQFAVCRLFVVCVVVVAVYALRVWLGFLVVVFVGGIACGLLFTAWSV